MTASPAEVTAGQKFGGMLAGLSMVFCSMEMVPGWAFLHLNWPPSVFYGIMAAAGAIAGTSGAPQHRIPGLIGGLIAGPSALFAVGFVLSHVTVTYDVALVLVALIGALPGFAVYKALAALEDAIDPPSGTFPTSLPRSVTTETQSFDATES